MSRLVGGMHFLFLRSTLEERKVFCYRRFDDAIGHSDAYTRLSPIFSINRAQPPAFPAGEETFLLFLGPVYPGQFPLDEFPCGFLTLGLLNVVIHSRSDEERARARGAAEDAGLLWEEWRLRGNTLLEYASSPPRPPSRERRSTPLAGIPSQIVPTARECLGHILGALDRASLHDLPTVEIFRRFDIGLRALLQTDIHSVEKLQFLVTSNVALSRHRWQAYSGIVPIIENPCQFSTHSLLGVGTASLALESLARFVEGVYDASGISTRLLALRETNPRPTPLIEILADDVFWRTDFLERSDHTSSDPCHSLPHITYFSGRDGFRSTLVSLSAPVETITGSNTPSWTLQTLTHEISHSVVRSVLGKLLPTGQEPPDLNHIIAILNHPDSAHNDSSICDIRPLGHEDRPHG